VMPILFTDYDKQLAQRVLDGDNGAVDAALALFERQDPTTLSEAARLIQLHGDLSPEAFDGLAQAFDRHWHLRDMPCN
jgi:hypothetical protein